MDDDEDDTVAFVERRKPVSTPRENGLEARVCKLAKSRGWMHKKIGTNGWPDQMFLRRGVIVFIEFKRAGSGRTSAQQDNRIRAIRDQGFAVYLIDNFEDGKSVFTP